VIGSALSSIVEEMGEALIRASFSTNIKGRRDCSTALTDDAAGRCIHWQRRLCGRRDAPARYLLGAPIFVDGRTLQQRGAKPGSAQ
jgi:hypothetical protein